MLAKDHLFWYHYTQCGALTVGCLSIAGTVVDEQHTLDENSEKCILRSAAPLARLPGSSRHYALLFHLTTDLGQFLFTHTAYRGNTAPPRNTIAPTARARGRQTE